MERSEAPFPFKASTTENFHFFSCKPQIQLKVISNVDVTDHDRLFAIIPIPPRLALLSSELTICSSPLFLYVSCPYSAMLSPDTILLLSAGCLKFRCGVELLILLAFRRFRRIHTTKKQGEEDFTKQVTLTYQTVEHVELLFHHFVPPRYRLGLLEFERSGQSKDAMKQRDEEAHDGLEAENER